MLLEDLQGKDTSRRVADDAFALMRSLYPICRSITGNGVRQSLDLIEARIPLQRFEVPSGAKAFDWEVPLEWTIREAYLADAAGRHVVDMREHTLHVVSYSTPVRRTLSLEDLQPHLYSLPDQPDLIPYRTSYYREHWGFCLSQRQRDALEPGLYEVVIDSDLQPGHLTYAECVIKGTEDSEAIVYTHLCHPSLANDNLTGLAVAAELAYALSRERPRLTWRFIFAPATIGSLVWLSRNEDRLEKVKAGLVIGLLGDAGPLSYKSSRRGGTLTDRVAEHVLRNHPEKTRLLDFEPYGYDERQFCSPGFDLPFGRITRSRNGEYPQYHTSADDLSFIEPDCLAGSIAALARIIAVIDANQFFLNLNPKGEPRLGKRGLYGSVGGSGPGALENAFLWLLSFSDKNHDLLAIAERSGLDFDLLSAAAQKLEAAGLLQTVPEKAG
jgi:aminopeptidase-like protein